MIPELRRNFNARFTLEKYRRFLAALDARCGTHVKFRVCETPCFFPRELIQQMAATGADLLEQLLTSTDYLRASDVTIPAAYRASNETPRPLFAAVDFGLVRAADGSLQPRLVEIQGFPSLYAFQVTLAQQFIQSYDLAASFEIVAGQPHLENYWQILRRAILGSHAPENVVLLEIDPLEQKTLPDFLMTERACGIRTVNIRDVVKEGNRLFYMRDGRRVPIHRIYNRAIVDELVRKQVTLPFDFRDELDVEWAGHPNWFFRISKFSVPHLRHPCVPRSWFLDQIDPVPDDLEDYVLKPLYSFAGLGVVVGPTRDDLARVPSAERHNYILQQRMRFEPVIETPHGPTQAEIRILYIDRVGALLAAPSSGSPGGRSFSSDKPGGKKGWASAHEAVSNWHLGPLIIRMGRGKMMGVDHNRDLEWVGASAGLCM